MRPITQTRFYDPALPAGEQRGNCLQAVVASLLELDLDDVPHFVQIDVDGGENWWDHLLRFLWQRGFSLVEVDPVQPPDGVHYMASGPSPRGQGIHHVVIYLDGLMVHDPHPERTGLVSVDRCYALSARG